MDLPSENREYSDFEYWQKRYSQDDDTFDWFKDFKSIKEQLTNLLPPKMASIINLGCGNSLFSNQIHQEGNFDIKVRLDKHYQCRLQQELYR
jgi:hypothetical protein